MTPKARTPAYRGLPDNLEPDPKTQADGTKVIYYRYKFPDGKRRSLGRDKAMAIEAANALNYKLQSNGAKELMQRVLETSRAPAANNPVLKTVIAEFKKHYLPSKKYSERSLSEINLKLAMYEDKWGDQVIRSFSTLQIAEFLNSLTVSPYIKHRKLLLDVFNYAGHCGYLTANPVSITLSKSDSERTKVRQRHTIEGYNKTYAAAPDWLRRAMDIALRSLQRRGDLTRLHRDQIHDDCIRILQRKTRNYKTPIYIDIQMGDELKAAVNACIRSEVPCPYLIHFRPTRIKSGDRLAKLHPFAVTDDYLSKQFGFYRDEAGAYDHLPKEKRPTFHEIRALGAHLYEEAGYSHEYIMALTGHASEKMLSAYLDGHKDPLPVLVRADLKIKK